MDRRRAEKDKDEEEIVKDREVTASDRTPCRCEGQEIVPSIHLELSSLKLYV